MSHLSRRELLLGGAALPLAGVPLRIDPRAPDDHDGVRNIIFMVIDGMSAGVPSLAEPFSQLVRGTGTQWRKLADAPETVRGYLETASLDTMVTDSAAASSAWSSGSRVNNGAVNMLPDGTRLTPIAELARGSGRAVGLATTTTITHATPAGFAAVEASRDDQHRIAPQYLDLVDVALGGGVEHFEPASRPDDRDLFAEYRQGGYVVCRTREELTAVRDEHRVLGVFSRGHLPYTVDQRGRPEAHAHVPSLAEMTRSALATLGRAPNGFLLQIEGGRVDHAAHANDAAAMLWEQLEFDDALRVAVAYTRERADTLLVVTTDHGTGNPGLNGIGSRYTRSTECFERLAGVSASFVTLGAALKRAGGAGTPPPVDDTIEIVRTHTGITLARDEAGMVALARAGRPIGEINNQLGGFAGVLGQALGNHLGVTWTGTTHTSDLAITLAIGPGRTHFAGVQHHTDVFGVLTGLMGIRHRNATHGT